VYLSFMKLRYPGVVPVDEGIMAVGTKHLCLGTLRSQNGRAVIFPQANILTEVCL
jgi:hypothetical protein